MPNRDRSCGTCTACCRLVPVAEIGKPAFTKCRHQFSGGCRIYKAAPRSCKQWGCAWLVMPEGELLSRPDRSGYVVDMMPDYVTIIEDDTGKELKIAVVQVWLDPRRPNAYRSPDLMRFVDRMAEAHGIAALIRLAGGDADGQSRSAIFMVPPRMNADRQWHFERTDCSEPEHTPAQQARELESIGIRTTAVFESER